MKYNLLLLIIMVLSTHFLNCGDKKKSLQGALLVNPVGTIMITPPGQEQYAFDQSSVHTSKGVVGQNYKIYTAANSHVDLQFQTGVSMRLGPLSNLVLDLSEIEASKGKAKIKLQLRGGSLVSQNQKLTSNSAIQISTPTLVASVRGTEFIVIDDSLSKLMVEEGSVEVSIPDSPEAPVVVEEGKKANLEDEEIVVDEMSEEELNEADDMSEGLDYMDEETANHLDTIIESFESEKERIHTGFEEQVESNKQIMQAEKERQKETFQNAKDRITGDGGAKSELERIKNLE